MSSILVKNIGALVTGELKNPLRNADSFYVEDGIIRAIGNGLSRRGLKILPDDLPLARL